MVCLLPFKSLSSALVTVIFCCFWLLPNIGTAQDHGSLYGQVREAFTGDPISHARISLQLDGAIVAQTTTDGDGLYRFVSILSGNYDLVICKLGLSPLKIVDVTIDPEEHTNFSPSFEAAGYDKDTITFQFQELMQDKPQKHWSKCKKAQYRRAKRRQTRAARRLRE